MNELRQRMATASVLIGGGILGYISVICFLCIWTCISVWILAVEWPRVAPWYTGVVYPGVPLLVTGSLYIYPEYRYLVWLGMCAAVIFDTGAYCIGRTFSRTYITPQISPNKTWEGTIGGFITLYVCIIAGSWVYHEITPFSCYLTHGVIAILLSAAAFFGDLLVSWRKRAYRIKDCSNILPGHGGLLDRCDSMLLCIPITYMLHMYTII